MQKIYLKSYNKPADKVLRIREQMNNKKLAKQQANSLVKKKPILQLKKLFTESPIIVKVKKQPTILEIKGNLPPLAPDLQKQLKSLKKLARKTNKRKRVKLSPKMKKVLKELAPIIKNNKFVHKSKKSETIYRVLPKHLIPLSLLACYTQRALTDSKTGNRVAYSHRWMKLGMEISESKGNLYIHPVMASVLAEYC